MCATIVAAVGAGCGAQPPLSTATATGSPTTTWTPSATATPSQTPTPAVTATPSETSTPEGPIITATRDAFCRWGPSTVYRSIGVDYLGEGESAPVAGRDYDATWFWVQLPGLSYHCWVSASIVNTNFEPKSVPYIQVNVPTNPDIRSARHVSSVRSDGQITISWEHAPDAPELEYLLEVTQCFSGYTADVAYSTTETSITLQDDQNCPDLSFGRIYVVNKEGYSLPVDIPWS